MAGKGKGKGKGASKGKKKLKHPNQVRKEKADGFTGHNFGEVEVGNSENIEELGRGESSNGNNRKLEDKDVFCKDVNELLEGIKITSSDHPRQVPRYVAADFLSLSAAERRSIKLMMEAKKISNPVHTPECGHQNLPRDIDDCGNNICWAIAALRCLIWNLKIKGGSNEMIVLNCERLLECYKEDKSDYPYILKKAFKYVKEHNVTMDAYYPKISKSDATRDKISEEVEALRLTGFQMIDHTDEIAIMMAIMNGPIIGGVRESPEYAMVGDGIYQGSDYEIVVDGKYCNHALLIDGYDYDTKEDIRIWKVVNLQDPSWGVEGEGKIARDSSLPNHRKHLLTTTMFPTFE